MAQNIQIIEAASASQRTQRSPAHTFNLVSKPFQIQPFLLAPVLPGETMQGFTFQSRVVTKPIASSIQGWWNEYYFFYVKHRDMPDTVAYQEMMLDANRSMSSEKEALAAENLYRGANSMDFVGGCLEAVATEYFSDESVTYANIPKVDGLPLAKIMSQTWVDSLALSSDALNEDFDIDADSSGTIEASEVETAMQTWQMLRMQNMTDMTYEDFLGTYGVKADRAKENVPELIRYFRDWKYPANTIDPSDGSAASAVSWGFTEKADKARFFKEPGFIFGVTVCRPKLYTDGMKGSLAGYMDSALTWLPVILNNDPHSSYKSWAGAAGPLAGLTANAYQIDMKDLFVHGDQFSNHDLSPSSYNGATMETGFFRDYPKETDIDNLFIDTVNPELIQDGIINFRISSTIVDTSGVTPAM